MASVVGPVSAALKAVTGLLQSGAGALSSALGLLAAPLLAVSSTAGALQPLVGGDKVYEVASSSTVDPVMGEGVSVDVNVVAASEAPIAENSGIEISSAPEAGAPEAGAPEAAVNFEQFFGGMRKMHSRKKRAPRRVLSKKRRSSSLKRGNNNSKRSKSRSRGRSTK